MVKIYILGNPYVSCFFCPYGLGHKTWPYGHLRFFVDNLLKNYGLHTVGFTYCMFDTYTFVGYMYERTSCSVSTWTHAHGRTAPVYAVLTQGLSAKDLYIANAIQWCLSKMVSIAAKGRQQACPFGGLSGGVAYSHFLSWWTLNFLERPF